MCCYRVSFIAKALVLESSASARVWVPEFLRRNGPETDDIEEEEEDSALVVVLLLVLPVEDMRISSSAVRSPDDDSEDVVPTDATGAKNEEMGDVSIFGEPLPFLAPLVAAVRNFLCAPPKVGVPAGDPGGVPSTASATSNG